jgi:hypothetical protein
MAPIDTVGRVSQLDTLVSEILTSLKEIFSDPIHDIPTAIEDFEDELTRLSKWLL